MYHRSSRIKLQRALALIVVFAATVAAGRLVQSAQEPKGNPEARKLKNPEPANSETIEAGRKLYARYCASCHGAGGKGDGGMALSGGTPSDLTDETWDYGSSDGEIFVVIRDGVSSDMLAYKDRLNERQIWQVVTFVRSVGPKPKSAESIGPVKDSRAAKIAPMRLTE